MCKNIFKISLCVTYLLSCSVSASKAQMRSATSKREASKSSDISLQDESNTDSSAITGDGSSTTVPPTVVPTVLPTGLPTVTSLGINLKWNLDKDCSSVGTNCAACAQFTTSTCPANPGGLACSTAYAFCVTPMGCRRFRCY